MNYLKHKETQLFTLLFKKIIIMHCKIFANRNATVFIYLTCYFTLWYRINFIKVKF